MMRWQAGRRRQSQPWRWWRSVFPGLTLAVVVWLLAGCSNEWYKEDADREVYDILEQKWKPEFPSQANYRVGDVEPGPNDVVVPAVAEVRGMLNLADAVQVATVHNRDYQRRKEDLYLSALSLTQDRHEFAPQLFGSLGGDYARNSSDESVSLDSSLGINQLLADGTSVAASIGTDWLRFLTGDPRMTLGSVLAATVQKPLLRGAGRQIVLENLTQAERDVLYELRDFNRYRKTFVVSIVDGYYRVLQTADQVDNAKRNYESLSYIYERTKMMADAGRMEPLRAGESLQDQLQAWDGYVQAQVRYAQVVDEFKIQLGLPTEAEVWFDPNELVALEALEVSEPNYDPAVVMATALDHRLDLATSADRVADAERKLIVAANGLAPELNLIATANVNTGDGTEFTRFQFHEGSYRLGFDFDPDLDRKSERNAYRRALINVERAARSYAEFEDDVNLQARQAYRDFQEAASLYEIQLLSLDLAEKRVEGEQLKLEAGVGVTRDLLNAQRSLLSAQNSKTAALVDYTLSQLRFARDLGILDVRSDGLWEMQLP